jgi:hypothetical protein
VSANASGDEEANDDVDKVARRLFEGDGYDKDDVPRILGQRCKAARRRRVTARHAWWL